MNSVLNDSVADTKQPRTIQAYLLNRLQTLLIQIEAGEAGRLSIEFYRGELLRDRQDISIDQSESTFAFELQTSSLRTGSDRLTCVIYWNGIEHSRIESLRPISVDNQGRIEELNPTMSQQTLMRYRERLSRLLSNQ